MTTRRHTVTLTGRQIRELLGAIDLREVEHDDILTGPERAVLTATEAALRNALHADTTTRFTDDKGRPLAVGDPVAATGTDDGVPLVAGTGRVVGFGRTRIRVQWHSFGYDDAKPWHTCPTGPGPDDTRRATVLRLDT